MMKRFLLYGLSAAALVAASLLAPAFATARETARPEPEPSELPPGIVPCRNILYTPGDLDASWYSEGSGPCVGMIQRVGEYGKERGEVDAVIFPAHGQVKAREDFSGSTPRYDDVNLTSRPYDANGAPGTWRFSR